MAERVHPHNSPSLSPNSATHIPKDHLYRDIPLHRRNNHRCNCCCCFLAFLSILILILAIAAAVFYLVIRPKALDYSLDGIAMKGLDLASPASSMSPMFVLTVRANNPNSKIGIRYLKESTAEVFFKNVMLCNGVMPAFYQPSKNVTVFMTWLTGNGIQVTGCDRVRLTEAEKKLTVPLIVKVRVPVEIKVGAIQTGKITFTAQCHVTVDKLRGRAKILSNHCDYGVLLFWVLKI